MPTNSDLKTIGYIQPTIKNKRKQETERAEMSVTCKVRFFHLHQRLNQLASVNCLSASHPLCPLWSSKLRGDGGTTANLATIWQQRKLSTQASVNVDAVIPKPFKDIPGPRGIYRIPYLGTALLFKPFTKYTPATIHLLIDELVDKYGPIVRVCIGPTMVLIADPEDITEMVRLEGSYPRRAAAAAALPFIYAKRNNMRHGLLELNGEEWYEMRSVLNKILLRNDSASYYLKPQSEVADEFAHILATQHFTPASLSNLFFKFAAESIGVVCFNDRLGLLEPNNAFADNFIAHIRNVAIAMHDTITGKSVMHRFYRNKTYKVYEAAIDFLKSFALKKIQQGREDLDQAIKAGTFDPSQPNLMFSLISADVHEEDIQNNIMALYAAGTESTARILTTFLYNLAKNPDVQERLHDEVTSVVAGKTILITADFQAMKYLKACLRETYRMIFPTPFGLVRVIPQDLVLSGYHVPKGVEIMGCNRQASRNLPDPDSFQPERWLRTPDKKNQSGLHPIVNTPFGAGARSCIGRRFAEQEIFLAASKIVQKLKIELRPGSEEVQFDYDLFVKPVKPIEYVFKKRQ